QPTGHAAITIAPRRVEVRERSVDRTSPVAGEQRFLVGHPNRERIQRFTGGDGNQLVFAAREAESIAIGKGRQGRWIRRREPVVGLVALWNQRGEHANVS